MRGLRHGHQTQVRPAASKRAVLSHVEIGSEGPLGKSELQNQGPTRLDDGIATAAIGEASQTDEDRLDALLQQEFEGVDDFDSDVVNLDQDEHGFDANLAPEVIRQKLMTRLELALAADHESKGTAGHFDDPEALGKVVDYLMNQRVADQKQLKASPEDHAAVSHVFEGANAKLKLNLFKSGRATLHDTRALKLGEGSFKDVYRGFDVDNLDQLAVMEPNSARAVDSMKEELKIGDKLGGARNVMNTLDRSEFSTQGRQGQGTVVAPRAAGDLSSMWGEMTRTQRLDMMIDMTTGLKDMHEKGWYHRDIKPENLLVDNRGRGMLGDLGEAVNAPELDLQRGTPLYRSPGMHTDFIDAMPVGEKGSVVPSQVPVSPERAAAYDMYALGTSFHHLLHPEAKDTTAANVRALEPFPGMSKAAMPAILKNQGDAGASEARRKKLVDPEMGKITEQYLDEVGSLAGNPDVLPEEELLAVMRNPDAGMIPSADWFLDELVHIRAQLDDSTFSPKTGEMPDVTAKQLKASWKGASQSGELAKDLDYEELAHFINLRRGGMAEHARQGHTGSHSLVFGKGRELMVAEDGKTFLGMGQDEELGTGTFKSAKRAIDVDSGNKWAMVAPKSGAEGAEVRSEVDALSRISPSEHLAVPQSMGSEFMRAPSDGKRGPLLTSPRPAMVQKLYQGDAQDLMADLGSREDRLDLMIDSLQGVVDLHDQGFAHRDLKPANIFIDQQGKGAIGDFGAATDSPTAATKGTPHFMAPDIFRRALARESGSVQDFQQDDIYAMGLTLAEIASGGEGVSGQKAAQEGMFRNAQKQGMAIGGQLAPSDHPDGYFEAFEGKHQEAYDTYLAQLRKDPNVAPESLVAVEMSNPDASQRGAGADYLARLKAIREGLKKT